MNRKLLFGLGVIGVIAADLVARTVLTGSAASSIGLLDAVIVIGGIALIQRWYKQEETASPQVPTPSPVIRAKPQHPYLSILMHPLRQLHPRMTWSSR